MAILAISALLIIVYTSQVYNTILYENYANSIDKFSGIFQEAISKKLDTANIVMSPLSVDIVMSMVAAGAQGETRKQITDVLALDNLETMYPYIRQGITDLTNVDGVTLNIANKLYVRSSADTRIVPAYQTIVQNVFKSEVERIDFKNVGGAVSKINKWVETKTNNNIKDLLNTDEITHDTSVVLLNAIYFKGTWRIQFNKTDTKKRDFKLTDGSTVKADTMFLKENLYYKKSPKLGAKILVLPYKGNNSAMVIILPDKPGKLGVLAAKLAGGITEHLKDLNEVELQVFLPKFKIETRFDFIDELHQLGIQHVFSPHSEVRGILEDRNIILSNGIQKALIEVNEEGSEASAASGVSDDRSIPAKFDANHPFMFVILQGNVKGDSENPGSGDFNGIPIFTGFVTDPTQ